MTATRPRLDEPEDLTAWIARLYANPELLRMGHNQRVEDLNLGLGWIYYGLARLVRPRQAVIIGSWRGFVPLVIARACQDNVERCEVHFVDPSLADDFWKDPAATQAHFRNLGLDNVCHHLHTTQEFVTTPAYESLTDIGLIFIDGYHSAEQARFDYRAFAGRLAPRGIVLFHDSMILKPSGIYGADRRYDVDVKHFIDELRRDPDLQLLDLPFGTGLTVLRKVGGPHGDVLSTEPRRGRGGK
ncbi:MAG: class I SAM-dependent methyltransferase [Gammaproteobacteria bacterium]|nr:class I SAM-dependent methyltransferase [Gammaproteobacteria bacterium]